MMPELAHATVSAVIEKLGNAYDCDRAASGVLTTLESMLQAEASSHPLPLTMSGAMVLILAGARFCRRNELGSAVAAVELAELWLAEIGYSVRATAQQKLAVLECALRALDTTALPTGDRGDTDLEDIREWLCRHVVFDATDVRLGALYSAAHQVLPGEVSGFIGCSITASEPSALNENEQVCERISAVFADAGIRSYVPILWDSPKFGFDWSDRPAARESDELQIAVTGVTVILLSDKAVGLGAVAELAARYGSQLVVITDDLRVTPMITGLGGGVYRIPLSGDLERSLRGYLMRNWPLLYDHALRLSENQKRWRKQINAILDGIELLPDKAMVLPPTNGMSPSRFHRLLAFEALWGGATHCEIEQLKSLLIGTPAPLSREERAALDMAASEGGWSKHEILAVERVGRERKGAVAEGARLRSTPKQAAYWIEIYEHHVR